MAIDISKFEKNGNVRGLFQELQPIYWGMMVEH